MPAAEEETLDELAERLLGEQNFTAALIAGALAMVFAAAGFGIIVSLLPVAYGFAAAAVGMIVGSAMLFAGRGIETKFGVAAALYTILGSLLGRLALSVIANFPPAQASRLSAQAFADVSPVDLLYLFVAVVAAVFIAKRSLSRRQWNALRQRQ